MVFTVMERRWCERIWRKNYRPRDELGRVEPSFRMTDGTNIRTPEVLVDEDEYCRLEEAY